MNRPLAFIVFITISPLATWFPSQLSAGEILALTANYRVNKYLTLSAVSTLAASQSNQSVFDYQVANLGGAVALQVKF